MENWEFLLQKEGDRTWLPLESPDVEVLEGRYRVVARSRLLNVSVELRITYLATADEPPKRRVQKRLAQTNDEGLIAVLPWTHFKPGIWEMCCQSEASAAGEPWRYQVQLEVLPSDSGELVAPDADDQGELESEEMPVAGLERLASSAGDQVPWVHRPDFAVLTPVASTGTSGADLTPDQELPSVVTADQVQGAAETSEEVPPVLPPEDSGAAEITREPVDYSAPAPEAPSPGIPPFNPDDHNPSVTPETEGAGSEEPLEIVLDQTHWVVKQGEAFVISGRVERVSTDQDSSPWPAPLPLAAGELQICLRDPQNSQVLVDTRQPVTAQSSPLVFACALYIPWECQTQVILGEVILWCQKVPVCQASFTITMPLEYLLGAIQQNFNPDQHQGKILTRRQQEDLMPPAWQPPRVEMSLPPQLYSPASTNLPETVTEPMPELPKFGNFLNPPSASPRSTSLYSVQSFMDLVKAKAEQGKTLETASVTAEITPDEIPEIPAEKPPSVATSSDPTATDPQAETFAALNHPHRFWSRLSSMAQDGELQNYLKVAIPELAELEAADPALGANVVQELIGMPAPAAEEWEVVVDYEPLEPPKVKVVSVPVPGTNTKETDAVPTGVLPEDQPIPTPEIEILAGEVVAGRPVKLRVRLPEVLSRIYVKVWLYDRQSQTIVDGPRWLTEFLPTGFGAMEALATLEAAYGCLEVEFAAIAVEMATQRESHKVTVETLVVPPGQPQLPLPE